jgi:putative glycosyltransferase (TIGR04348 family)
MGRISYLPPLSEVNSSPVKIHLVTPAGPTSHEGNRTTAIRWSRILSELGHDVGIAQEWNGEGCDVLIALHARKSFPSIERFRRARANAPLVVALTGTDVYSDLATSTEAKAALGLASRLVVLQPLAADALPERERVKVRVIYQSAAAPARAGAPEPVGFQVCLLLHLRPVKDPFRCALAVRGLPSSSAIRVAHAGAALSPEFAEQARAEEQMNPRYRWLGDLPHAEALDLLARSSLLVVSSQLEGGANVISEALAVSVPVVSSRISGSIGLLGPSYPGYFEVGNTKELRALLLRAESDEGFYQELRGWCERLKPLVDPARERASWKSLLAEFH